MFKATPFPSERGPVIDAGRLALRRHIIHGLLEIDVTRPRRTMRAYKEQTGQSLSFTAFIVSCLAQAIEQQKMAHAYRDWRNRLILFDEVDVVTLIEAEKDGVAIPRILRAANRKFVFELHDEIRAVQTRTAYSQQRSGLAGWSSRALAFVRSPFYWFLRLNPYYMNELTQITIYTDGGCDPNPGPGGYGVVLLFGAHRKELSGGFRLTTNSRMEILAVIKGLEALKEPCQVSVYSDSKYLVDAIQRGWAKRWQERNWMRNSKDAAINPDLWELLLALCETHQVKFAWLKGHAGIPENERCDQLSTQALHQPDLPADEGYESRPEDAGPVRITDEGQPCRKCGAPVVKRKPRKLPKADQEYRMEYYLHCPQCGTNYTVEDAKKPVEPPPSLF